MNMASLLRGICETAGGGHTTKTVPAEFLTCHPDATGLSAQAAHTWAIERTSPMATSSFTPVQSGDFESGALNDNNGRTADVQASSRILVALQDPEARRWMSRGLRAKGFRVIALDEPFDVWSMVAEHASPRLSGFDFVICRGFRSDRRPDSSCAQYSGVRFFLLLGPGGFVPFAADGIPPPACAFFRAGTRLVQDEPKQPGSTEHVGRPAGAPAKEAAPVRAQ